MITTKSKMLRDDYIEKNCNTCNCRRGCELYDTLLHMDTTQLSISEDGYSDVCSFKNIKGVSMNKIIY